MDIIPDNITPLQFWLGVLIILAPQIYNIYNRWLDAKEKKRIADAEEKEKQRKAEADAEEVTWKRVVSEYDRALARAHALEEELKQLRPLALQNAILEQKRAQCAEDKDDWKDHAVRLEEQLKEHNIIPVPFRRHPREDTAEKLKTVSRRMKTIKNSHMTKEEYEADGGSPTLVFPPITEENK